MPGFDHSHVKHFKDKNNFGGLFSFVPTGQRLYSVMHGLVLLDWTANCLKSTNRGGVADCRASSGVLTQPRSFLHRRFCGLVFPGRIYGATASVSWRSSPHSFSFKQPVETFVFIVIILFYFILNLSLHSRWLALFCDMFFQHCTWTPGSRVVVNFCSDVAPSLWSLQSRAQLSEKSFLILACKLFCVVFSVNRFLWHLLDVTAEFCDRATIWTLFEWHWFVFFCLVFFRFGFVLEPSQPS